ncbi:MAG: hypothetical protein IT349_19230 [Candidatus Eisenbacteria bacterium]|nr:hypothetical protein [Candidatus Eisenbacteria bacterium]
MGLGASDYLKAQVINHLLRANTFSKPADIFVGLIRASRGAWSGATVYNSGDTVYPTSFAGRMYRCTTGGTSHASTQPTWPTTDGGTVADGTVVWTEHTPSMEAGTNLNEVTGSGYARIEVAQSDAKWSAPGAAGLTQNVDAVEFGAPSADWGSIGHWFIADHATAGNLLLLASLSSVFVVNSGNPAPKFLANAMSITFG